MTYKNYEIKNEYGHYLVTAPNGEQWTEDTIDDARHAIEAEVYREDEEV